MCDALRVTDLITKSIKYQISDTMLLELAQNYTPPSLETAGKFNAEEPKGVNTLKDFF